MQRPVYHRAMRDTCSCMHQENSSVGVSRPLWHSCDTCENRAKIVQWKGQTPQHARRRWRVPGGSRRDWSVLPRGLQVVRRRTHPLDMASRYALGVLATYRRNSAVK